MEEIRLKPGLASPPGENEMGGTERAKQMFTGTAMPAANSPDWELNAHHQLASS